MKGIMAFVFFALLVSVAHAGTPTVKITSFRIVGPYENRLTEICGVVNDMTESPTFVKVVMDPSSKSPGIYNTLAGKDGRWCLTGVAYTLRAEATLW